MRVSKCGRLYTWLGTAKKTAGPDVGFVTFHTFRHTWATWMRRYAGLDTRGLVGTGAWRDHASAERYQHVEVTEEARKADLLPVKTTWKGRKNARKPA
ncbi:MAG: integrase [Xanthobacteraceae bacterium]|jgi:integrase|nr:integrase [Xanthobacteraceae bacterium]